VRGELTTQISLNRLTKFAFARTRSGAVRGRVRDVNAVESIKLIRPTGKLTLRVSPTCPRMRGIQYAAHLPPESHDQARRDPTFRCPVSVSYLYSPRGSPASLFSVGNMLSYIARAS
jgi:hypothetical protein